jgi:hypothetical protein
LDRGQRAVLRAKLLLGVAGATAAASTAAYADQAPAAPPANANKWAPYSDFGGSVGSGMVGGKLDFFVPLFQNLDSMAFLNLGVGTETKANVLYNFGAGYRTKIDSDWIVGVYAGHDGTQLEDNNTFGQTSFSAELMSADWDAHLNAYLADNAKKQVPGAQGLYINGTTIAVLDAQDVGYSGFDGEVGYRVFSTDDTDVRVFVGGFHFSHGDSNQSSMGQSFDFGYRDISGFKGRAEATVYDLDIIGNQSRVTLNGQIAHDDVRGTTGSFGLTLRIPLGAPRSDGSSGAQALDELDRRMADPVRRNDQVLTRAQYTKPEPVIIYGPHVTSQPTNTLLYVDGTATASVGTYAHPTTLPDAVSRNTTNAFIVLDSKAGPIPGGVTLQPGQTLVPGGDTFTVEGEVSHAKFTHLFDPSTTPTLVPATAGGTVLTLANNTSLYGFAIEGNFGNAIYGKNVDNVNISHITIDGTGGGQTGINLQHTVSGEEKITIQNVAVSNVTQDGIYLSSRINDGGSSTQTFTLSNITVTNAGDDGIYAGTYAGAGSKITNSLSLSNAVITNPGGSGIFFRNAAVNGAALSTSETLSNVTVTGGTEDGIGVYSFAVGGATIGETLSISGSTISGLTGFSSYGIYVGSNAASGAAIVQTASIMSTSISHISNGGGSGTGLDFYAYASGVGSVDKQNITLTDVNVSYAKGHFGGQGIVIAGLAGEGASVAQYATITSSSATNSGTGLFLGAAAHDNGYVTTAYQKVSVTGGNFSNDANYGVLIQAEAGADLGGYHSLAAVTQKVSLASTTMDNNGVGLSISGGAISGASTQQVVSLYGVDISHNTGDGVSIEAKASYLGFVTQSIEFNNAAGSYNEISYNGANGIYVKTNATYAGQINQHLYVYSTNIDHNVADGVSVRNTTSGYYFGSQIYYSHLQQNLVFAYGSISHNGGDGISIYNTVGYTAQEDQFIDVYKETIDHNAGHGFFETSIVTTYQGYGFTAPTNLHSDVYIYNSDLSYNGGTGILIASLLKSPTYIPGDVQYSYLEQHITVSGTTATYNAGSGFAAFDVDVGVFGFNAQYITLTGSTFAHNVRDGADFYAIQYFGPGGFGAAVQDVTITNSTLSHNTENGLYAYAYASGEQGRAEQHFTVTGSHFDYNGGSGIYLRRVAENGVYVPGFACTAVQGLGGGCAFVRQTFDMTGGSASYNQVDGLYIHNYATHYGAIYNESGRPNVPTVYLKDVQFNGNGNDGFYERNIAKNYGYIFNFVEAIGSTFNYNGRDGFHVNAYASDKYTIVEGLGGPPTVLLYGAQLNGNGRDGFYSQSTALNQGYVSSYIEAIDTTFNNNVRDGFHTYAYASGSAHIAERNLLYSYATGTTANGNGRFGVNIYDSSTDASFILSSNSTLGLFGAGITANGNALEGIEITATNFASVGYVQQVNSLYDNTTSSNSLDGIYLVAFGTGVGTGPFYQSNKLVGNTITANGRYGVFGESLFGAYQKINIYTGGNTVTGNPAGNYDFVAFFATNNVY